MKHNLQYYLDGLEDRRKRIDELDKRWTLIYLLFALGAEFILLTTLGYWRHGSMIGFGILGWCVTRAWQTMNAMNRICAESKAALDEFTANPPPLDDDDEQSLTE